MRWAQLRDRVINVPVPTANIKNTIQKLPSNPSDSGLIGVNWKRKTSYKNTHKREFIDENRVFNGLEYLIQHNPLYKDSIIDKNFLDSCKLKDPVGHEFFVGPNQNINSSEPLTDSDDELFLNIQENNLEDIYPSSHSSEDNEIDKQDKDYREFA